MKYIPIKLLTKKLEKKKQDIKGPWIAKTIFKKNNRDFPGDPVVKTLPSNAGGASSIPGQGAKIPHASGPKNQNIKQAIL